MKVSTLFAGLILLLLVILLVISMHYTLEMKLLPSIFIMLAITFAIAQILREVLSKQRHEVECELNIGEWITKLGGINRDYLIAIGWIMGFLLSIFLLGFLITIPLFAFLYLKFHGESWKLSISLSVIVSGIIYCGFVIGLKVSLYKGFLISLLF